MKDIEYTTSYVLSFLRVKVLFIFCCIVAFVDEKGTIASNAFACFKLKAQENLSDQNMCIVCRRCYKLFTFLSTSPDQTTGPIST